MAVLTAQTVIETGLEATYAACAAGGDLVANPYGDVILHVKNGHTSAQTVTVTAQVASKVQPGFGPMTKASVAVAVTEAEERFIGPFPRDAFNNGSGQLAITYSGVNALTIAALRVPRAA